MKLSLLLILFCISLHSQDFGLKVNQSGVYNDETHFSTLKFAQTDGKGNTVIIRSYLESMLSTKYNYMLEVYDKDLKLKSSQKFEFKIPTSGSGYGEGDILGLFIKNDIVKVISIEFNKSTKSFDFLAYTSPIEKLNFGKSKLLSFEKSEMGPLNYLSGYSTQYTNLKDNFFLNQDQSAFCIVLDKEEGKNCVKNIYVFDSELNNVYSHVLSRRKTRFYHNIFDIKFTNDKELYILSKLVSETSEQNKKYGDNHFEITKLSGNGKEINTEVVLLANKELVYPKLVLTDARLYCIGFTADKRKMYDGLSFNSFDTGSLKKVVTKEILLTDYFKERTGTTKKKIDYLYSRLLIKKSGVYSNGNVYIAFEKKNFEEKTCFDGVLGVYGFSPEGELLNENIFGKGQIDGTVNLCEYSSFTAFQNKDELFFVMNIQDFGKKDAGGNLRYVFGSHGNSSLVAVKYNVKDGFIGDEIVKKEGYPKKIARAGTGIVLGNSVFLLGGTNEERVLYEINF